MSSTDRNSGAPKWRSAVSSAQSISICVRYSPSHLSPSCGSVSPHLTVMRSARSSPDLSASIASASPSGTVSPVVDELEATHVYVRFVALVVTYCIWRCIFSSTSSSVVMVHSHVKVSTLALNPAALSSPTVCLAMLG